MEANCEYPEFDEHVKSNEYFIYKICTFSAVYDVELPSIYLKTLGAYLKIKLILRIG
jgi:hypothetical protein